MPEEGRKQVERGDGSPPPEWEGGAPAGWYLDPDEAPRRRYWDGSAWTDDTYEPPDRDEGARNRTLVTIAWTAALIVIALAILAAIAASIPDG